MGNRLAARMNEELLSTPGKFTPVGVRMECAPGRSCVRADSAEAARRREETAAEDRKYKKAADERRAAEEARRKKIAKVLNPFVPKDYAAEAKKKREDKEKMKRKEKTEGKG